MFSSEGLTGEESTPTSFGSLVEFIPCSSRTEGPGFLLDIVWRALSGPRGCLKFLEAAHISLLHGLLDTDAYFVKPARGISL